MKGNYDTKSEILTLTLESESDVRIFSTVNVPAKNHTTLTGSQGHFKVKVLPTSGSLGGRILADGAIRRVGDLPRATVEEGTNAMLGFRGSSPGITWIGGARMLL